MSASATDNRLYRIEVRPRVSNAAPTAARLRAAGLEVSLVRASRLYLLEGRAARATVERVAQRLLTDPVTQYARVTQDGEPLPPSPPGAATLEVHLLPGVMDPAAESVLTELLAEGCDVERVRTAWRYELEGVTDAEAAAAAARRSIANECIERVFVGAAPLRPAPRLPPADQTVRLVRLRGVGDEELAQLSRRGHLFLTLDEMRAVRSHFERLQRDPTDLELETIAQTWSEHCVHKTLKSAIVYSGAAMPKPGVGGGDQPAGEVELRYDNLLKDTIARATHALSAAQRGPECLSVFVDNAGVIAFDDDHGLAFKVETHNRPSAIEPYGGAATGIGGCIRDVMGCGLGAKPIASTDVFCVAPGDWPAEALPAGVLHPARVLQGVVRGVADYGNRMGIPTVNGAVHFDPRYLGNPLVYCGCVGLIPRRYVHKQPQAGDLIVVMGGRTGRDGIHGATFSSAELTTGHADEFAHAVQIGNAITEKRVLDALLAARDHAVGCLYTAVTDCGAGGLSSAVGEMSAALGALVDLERAPLKYDGLRYDEIWISEAQERMVLSVPQGNLPTLLEVAQREGVEATVIGVFGETDDAGAPRLTVRYAGAVVGALEMHFLHEGYPRTPRQAVWQPAIPPALALTAESAVHGDHPLQRLREVLRDPDVASKAWIVRAYDHEVQGGSVIKPLGGSGDGPNDAAVVSPRLGSGRGVAIGNGLCPELGDVDPYWMALAAIDEALRNVVCVGGDPAQTAILDNFCWGRTDDPEQLGALVRACQACHDGALAYATPFISGKDSLNNELVLADADQQRVLAELRQRWSGRGELAEARLRAVAARLQRTGRLSIPATLLISAISLVEDVSACVSADLKEAGHALYLVGGLPRIGFDPARAAVIHREIAWAQRQGRIAACHDVSDGGWLTAVAEMAIGGDLGAELSPSASELRRAFLSSAAGYVIETPDAGPLLERWSRVGVAHAALGRVTQRPHLALAGQELAVAELRQAWLHETSAQNQSTRPETAPSDR